MCRIVAYQGPPIRLSALLVEPAHGLVRQSYAPRLMTDGQLNADGWGVGWFTPEPGLRPGVLKGVQPIWSDENAEGATPAIRSGTILAIVRGATPGLGVSAANTPPYVWPAHLYAHNGRIWPWSGTVARELRIQLDPEEEAGLRGTTDSEMLGALWRTHLRRQPEQDAAEAIRTTLATVRSLAVARGGGLSATVVLAGLDGLLAVRFAEPGPPPTLFSLEESARWPGATVLASEPLDDDPGWKEVPPGSLVRADDRRGVRTEPLY